MSNEMVEKPESDKISKALANYQGRPMLEEYCEDCTKFIEGQSAQSLGRCVNVAGPISPQGWCRFFERKEGEAHE